MPPSSPYARMTASGGRLSAMGHDADIASCPRHVRSFPQSRHSSVRVRWLSATSGHVRRRATPAIIGASTWLQPARRDPIMPVASSCRGRHAGHPTRRIEPAHSLVASRRDVEGPPLVARSAACLDCSGSNVLSARPNPRALPDYRVRPGLASRNPTWDRGTVCDVLDILVGLLRNRAAIW